MASERIKNALRSFAWNLVDLDDRNFYNDSKKTRIIKGLRKRAVILKPDKGQGIVLLRREDYVESMERIFADRSKFKEVESDNTISRVENLKRYLNTLLNRGEITESEKKDMRMKGANQARSEDSRRLTNPSTPSRRSNRLLIQPTSRIPGSVLTSRSYYIR